MTDRVTSSIVLPPWRCPECGYANVHTTARCQNRRHDPNHPTYHAVPPVPPGVDLRTLGRWMIETLGLPTTEPPPVIWRCSYGRSCELCDKPARPHSGGELRCDDHPLQPANVRPSAWMAGRTE